MSNNEVENYIRNLDEGLAEAEKIMLEEKANRGELLVNSDANGNIIRVSARDVIAHFPQN